MSNSVKTSERLDDELYWASCSGRSDVLIKVDQLLKAGANVNCVIPNRDGTTPLHEAAMKGNAKLCELLLKAGAEVNTSSDDGRTPLHACITDEPEFVLDPFSSPPQIIPPSAHAELLAEHSRRVLDVARVLIEHGADINAHDDEGQSAVYHAVGNNQLGLLSLLIKHGGNPDLHGKVDGTGPICICPRDLGVRLGNGSVAVMDSLIALRAIDEAVSQPSNAHRQKRDDA